ncbi:MAG: hypothetical protein JWN90_333 [Parcubacteria group bacterium]|nr:hypothetical protein [Parcubacteria group bacterium]
MQRISETIEKQIIELRKTGKSIPEISQLTRVGRTTVQRYVLNIEIPNQYLDILREKQGGAKQRALALRFNTLTRANVLLGNLSARDYLMLLVGIYWGEGTKRDFGIINSDPYLIQTFIVCLSHFSIQKNRLSISLRVHSDIDVSQAKKFWSRTTGLSLESITQIEIIEGKKNGKLKYGMCRIRIRKGIRERLLIQSLISLIGKDSYNELLSA